MEVDHPRPFAWRELLHPLTETLHVIGFLACLYIALIAWHVLRPAAFMGMKGFGPQSPGFQIAIAFVALMLYPLGLLGANLRATKTGHERHLPEDERLVAARNFRFAFAILTLMLACLSCTELLGIAQSANGFDWNRRWP